jgi:hypothetical protein
MLDVDIQLTTDNRGMDESANRIWDTTNRGVQSILLLDRKDLADPEYSDNGRISSTNT